jgi:hypothetical protein
VASTLFLALLYGKVGIFNILFIICSTMRHCGYLANFNLLTVVLPLTENCPIVKLLSRRKEKTGFLWVDPFETLLGADHVILSLDNEINVTLNGYWHSRK